ncbi:DUF3558 family protein [Streptomyces noursei]|uniref:Uncharacterized protein n=1 Tax=Streptomyces noursei TaxID=1971 RepID=A0A059VYI9_STRNR|nr:DUF3558 family protein [Streptomyces noursei]AKA04646.1 hypothetical protein SAZ_20900 [Streptomyces noursei ZPM]AIA04444.1 hypothetical protein DC74_3953 [Streptomyces noursei]EOT00770.1 hypothetical protein K530_27149 [Streptomyces noursei CCRC 11814]EXU90177.1 hypothetical protein P354_18330 [Streptomyces noursei PD-1]MCZ0971311.1 DUF3558 family protein [Streptomyces noursei]
MHRSAKRLASLLTCAAVPVLLVAGCSGSDGKSSGDSTPSGSSSAAASSPSPTVAAAKFKKLPNPCEAFSKDTLNKLLPKVKDAAGSQGKSTDTTSRGACSWSSSDDQGVDGTQFRWLDVAFQRYDSDPTIGSGEKRATDFYTQQINDAKATQGAKKVAAVPTAGTGDAATAISYDVNKEDNDFKNTTIVARTANIVVTLNYNGAGMAGADTPNGNDLLKAAQAAAKEAVTAATKANQG